MFKEPAVLGGKHRGNQVGGDGGEPHRLAQPVSQFAEVANEFGLQFDALEPCAVGGVHNCPDAISLKLKANAESRTEGLRVVAGAKKNLPPVCLPRELTGPSWLVGHLLVSQSAERADEIHCCYGKPGAKGPACRVDE